jgi:hypothetical protein
MMSRTEARRSPRDEVDVGLAVARADERESSDLVRSKSGLLDQPRAERVVCGG